MFYFFESCLGYLGIGRLKNSVKKKNKKIVNGWV